MNRVKMSMLAVLLLAALTAIGCSKNRLAPTAKNIDCGYEVIVSLANQDRLAPIALTEVIINGTTIFHGALQPLQSGDYLYVSTRVPEQRVEIEVKSEIAGKVTTSQKKVWVEDRLWVVVTRIREFDGEPEVRIEISYESPQL
ncbi:MAG: hypothetical protein GY847_10430 [Proteobacteria bacterium]|nr:hypothetical protein [Pseudomonadota bacterium]